MSSKTLGVFIILIFIALATALAFQYLEMDAYGIPQSLKERFFPAQAEVAVDAPPAETTSEE
jgi:hypothetical protein